MLKYLIVFSLCTLATSKVALQSAFSKKNVKNTTDALLFNACVFTVASIIFFGQMINCPPKVLIYGIIFGAFTVIFQITYTLALTMQNVSLTVMIVNISMVIPIIFSVAVYNETITVFQIIGAALTVFSFVVSVDLTKKQNSKLGLILSICAFLANGGLAITQKMFGKSIYAAKTTAFVSCSYIAAAIFALTVFLIFQRRQSASFKIRPNMLAYAIGVGIILALFQVMNTYAISKIDAAFLFPTYSGGSIILSSLCGIIIFKDKLNTKQKISLITGIAAVILMNF